jgi:abi-alpha protein
MNIEEIKELILLKQEDSYWDFKREWYAQDKKQIYFMILCVWQIIYLIEMLIFIIGVDEENDYSFSSVKTDLNRRNTQQLVNFI